MVTHHQRDNQTQAGSAWRDPASYLRFLLPVAILLPLDLFSKYWSFYRFHQRPAGQDSMTVVPRLLEFRTVLNQGALFGIGHGRQWFFIIASVLACLFVGYLFVSSGRHQRRVHLALALVLAGALGNLYDRATVRLDKVTLKTVSNPTGEHADLLGIVTAVDDQALTVAGYPRGDNPQRIPLSHVLPRPDGRLYDQTSAVRDFIHIRWTFSNGKAPWPWIFNLADVYLCAGVGLLVLNWRLEARRSRRHAPDQLDMRSEEIPIFDDLD